MSESCYNPINSLKRKSDIFPSAKRRKSGNPGKNRRAIALEQAAEING